jgi:MHS family proline/betaine transporter-like MFS transporter
LTLIIIATSLVNSMEVYNITVFGLFASVIARQFFPATNPLTSLLFAAATFAFGFLMRPLGALLIGTFADRVGRRAALTLTIWMTALGTGIVAFCPGYATIGVAAPIILVVGRSLEGLAAGGELGAAASFAVETRVRAHRGWINGWQLSAQAAAALFGACLGAFLSSPYSPISPEPWGWRVPFIVSLLIVPVAILVRQALPEQSMRATAACHQSSPLKILFTQHAKTVMLLAMLMAGRTVVFYAIVYFMPSYLSQIVHMPAMTGFIASAFSAAMLVILSPFTGWLADRFRNLQRLNVIAVGILLALVYPVFALATHQASFAVLLTTIGIVCVALALVAPASNVLMLNALPIEVRVSGFAFSYGIGVTIFGGTAQFIITALVARTGNPMAPAWYLMAACFLSLIAALCLKPIHEADS